MTRLNWTRLALLSFTLTAPSWPPAEAVLGSPILLSEKKLKDFALEGAPEISKLIAQALRSSVAHGEYQDRFSPSLFSNLSYLRSKEDPVISYQPIYSPKTVAEIGIQKTFASGISAKLTGSNDTREFSLSGTPEKRSIAYGSLELDIDLWKNFLGRTDQNSLDSLEAALNQTVINKELGVYTFLTKLRGHYWKLVAIDESIKISQNLFESAKKQEQDAKERYKSSIADKSELARYKAQSASRSSSVSSLQFQKEVQIRELKKLVSNLKNTEVLLAPYDLDLVVGKVLECVTQINNYQDVPLENTLYDELGKEIETYHNKKEAIAETYNDIDIQLSSTLYNKAVNDNAPDAISDASSKDKMAYQVSLGLTIPLGGGNTEEDKVKAERIEKESQTNRIYQNLASTHQFMKKSINLLIQSIQSQKSGKENLEIRLKEVAKKYRQGRISVGEYINDQDALFQTELQIIDTKSAILQTLLEYLNVFTKTPCSFNRI